jgi:glycosyltransferase involved in cell wall biosynthesis
VAASPLARSVEITHPVAVVVPAYRVAGSIADVVSRIPAFVRWIYVVDDACPERSGERLRAAVSDTRIQVLVHETNQGVGGASITGFRRALADGAEIVVKLDGDGQMDPAFLPELILPIQAGEADYAKGNRFWDIEGLSAMPWVRLWGNSVLSLVAKFSSGYWNLIDPTNGYVAIHREALRRLPLDKVSRRYFFESDLLFRLYTVRAVVCDVAMPARYGDERSALRAGAVIPEFLYKHSRNLAKRLFYAYFLRDFSIASVELGLGILLLLWGVLFGSVAWVRGAAHGEPATAGTVMLAALPVILGVQFLLGFLQFDYRRVGNTRPVHSSTTLPGLAPAWLALASLIAVASTGGSWGRIPWSDSWYRVRLPKMAEASGAAVFVDAACVSYVLPSFPATTRFFGVTQLPGLRTLVARELRAHQGPILRLTRADQSPSDLAPYGLSDTGDCEPVRTRRFRLELCRLARDGALAAVAARWQNSPARGTR